MASHQQTTAAVQRLAHEVQLTLSDPTAKTGPPRIARIEVDAPETDLLAWLQPRTEDTKIFWSNRDESFAVAGVGAASQKSAQSNDDLGDLFDSLRANLTEPNNNLRYFGGLRFDTDAPSDPKWAPFATYHFVIPQLEYGVRNGHYFLACNLSLPDTTETDGLLQRIASADSNGSEPHSAIPEVLQRSDTPELPAWSTAVTELLSTYTDGPLEKVVLARESVFTLAGEADPTTVLRALMANTSFSYHYLFQPKPGAAFVGASPERLFKRAGKTLESEALAGTRPRGATPEDDARLGQELLASDKEVQEHRFVVDSIRALFDAQCETVNATADPELLHLRHCQHLLIPFEGTLRTPGCDADLLAGLHPTPAVGGVPRPDAMARIAAVEDFDRGWYTGPVGWVSHDATEFAVAIRSALVRGADVSVYAGAGIVPGSKPQDEWDELENKVADFRGILEGTRSTHEAIGR